MQGYILKGAPRWGWCYDAYPELKPLNAGAIIPVAEAEGSGVITCIHSTQHLVMPTPQTHPLFHPTPHTPLHAHATRYPAVLG
ncbi:MAG: hypothetical protein KatS3mg022_2018 [Armatimonadota bacterium]|nr:MAG: hypothetical protein KatS3mg022_2018 [Armatimonadota bacterium]GIV19584.1 MAG: hypothetical protein KatS3mg023_1335 [Armatimonadota bacterium]